MSSSHSQPQFRHKVTVGLLAALLGVVGLQVALWGTSSTVVELYSFTEPTPG